MHTNTYIETNIGKTLTKVDELGTREVVGAFTGRKLGAMCFREASPIDGVWTTPYIVISGASVVPAGYGV